MPVNGSVQAKVSKRDAEGSALEKGWLATCPPAFREELVSRSQRLTFEKGSAIYRVEDEPKGVYGLVDGLLRIEFDVMGLGEQVAFIAKPGFWIGAASLIHRRKRKLTLNCAHRSTVLFLPTAAFEAMAKDPEAMRCFARLAIDNNDVVLSLAKDLMNSDLQGRIASRLSAIFCTDDQLQADDHAQPLPITQSDLAMVCNVSRKTMNLELGKLERMGVLSRAYGKLIVKDAIRLQQMATGAVSLPR